MNTITIQRTTNSPDILLDPKKGIIEIKGASFLEDSSAFYSPILDWVAEYVKSPVATTVHVELTYFNSSAAKLLLTIFKILGAIEKKNISLTLNWSYSEDDEDIRDSGHDFSKLSGIKFNMIENDEPERD